MKQQNKFLPLNGILSSRWLRAAGGTIRSARWGRRGALQMGTPYASISHGYIGENRSVLPRACVQQSLSVTNSGTGGSKSWNKASKLYQYEGKEDWDFFFKKNSIRPLDGNKEFVVSVLPSSGLPRCMLRNCFPPSPANKFLVSYFNNGRPRRDPLGDGQWEMASALP